MAKKKRKIREEDLEGFKYFKVLEPFVEKLHSIGTEGDRAGNRKLFFDQYGSLLLLYFFNPIVTSLRGIQQASELKKVQRVLRCSRASLGSLSEASQVFDAEVLKEVIAELSSQVAPLSKGKELEALKNLTAVDGSLLRALPKMSWALWVDEKNRAAKMHLVFEVFRGVPVDLSITEGNASEAKQLRGMLEAGRLYVTDRGYNVYALFQAVIDVGSSIICRLRGGLKEEEIEERPLSEEALNAGVQRDVVVRFGTATTTSRGSREGTAVLDHPFRVVEVKTGKVDANGEPEVLRLATDRMDIDAELIALAYRYRWSVELYFRWFKCVLGCRHLLSQSQNGVEIQVYVAIIASLLISLWTGRKPTKRTFEMICFYFSGWASEEELLRHIETLKKHDA
jgi:hypothetical protein